MCEIETELRYFDAHQADLRRKYPSQYIVIKGEEFIRAFSTTEAAIAYVAGRYGLQSVLIRHVDRTQDEVSIPALTMGLLRAGP